MSSRLGIIGCGNMASAIIGGIVKTKYTKPQHIIVSDIDDSKLSNISELYGVRTTKNNEEVVEAADILILAVKPNLHESVLEEAAKKLKIDTIVVTIAAGIDMDYIESRLGSDTKVVRTMPNTPSLVGAGMTAMCCNSRVTEEDVATIKSIFESFGEVEVVEESLMDYVPSLSGSSPAYAFMFIEALADGGVASGFPRDKAYRMAAQAVLGAARMILDTEEHPGKLKDMVCTPSGATIQAVIALEKNNFRGSILEAMKVCDRKSVEMQSQKLDKQAP